jgi:hypothetical protein
VDIDEGEAGVVRVRVQFPPSFASSYPTLHTPTHISTPPPSPLKTEPDAQWLSEVRLFYLSLFVPVNIGQFSKTCSCTTLWKNLYCGKVSYLCTTSVVESLRYCENVNYLCTRTRTTSVVESTSVLASYTPNSSKVCNIRLMSVRWAVSRVALHFHETDVYWLGVGVSEPGSVQVRGGVPSRRRSPW